jgi:hypothetical protein
VTVANTSSTAKTNSRRSRSVRAVAVPGSRKTGWAAVVVRAYAPAFSNGWPRLRSNPQEVLPAAGRPAPMPESGLQSDRARVCEIESVPPRVATAQLRPGRRARGDRAAPLHAAGMPQLCPALRLSRRYSVMKNALIQRRLERAARTKLLLVCTHAVSDSKSECEQTPAERGWQAAHQDAPRTARAALNPRLSFIRRPPVFSTNRFRDRQ